LQKTRDQRKLSCGSRSLNDRDQFWRTFCGILPNKNIWSVFNRDNPQMSTPCGTSFPPRGILYFTPEFFYRICGVSLNATGAFIPLGELFVSMGILFFPMGKSFVAIEKIFPPGGNPLRDSGMLPSQPDSRQCACGTHSSGQSQCPAKILRQAFSRQSVGEFEPQAPTNGSPFRFFGSSSLRASLIFPMLRRDAAGDQLTIPRAEAPHFVPPLRFQRSRANDQDLRYSSFACE